MDSLVMSRKFEVVLDGEFIRGVCRVEGIGLLGGKKSCKISLVRHSTDEFLFDFFNRKVFTDEDLHEHNPPEVFPIKISIFSSDGGMELIDVSSSGCQVESYHLSDLDESKSELLM